MISSLYLNNFRSYGELSLDSNAKAIVITGGNGTGKTNILEAVSLLSPSKGIKKAKLENVKKFDAPSWGISAGVLHPIYGNLQIGVGDLGGPVPKKIMRMDGEILKSHQEIGKIITQLWLTPSMDRFVVDSPALRREFIDHIGWAFHTEHATHISSYEQTIKERSKLLKEGNRDKVWLGSLEKNIVQMGVAIVSWREVVLKFLKEIINETIVPLDFPGFDINITGEIEDLSKNISALELEALFCEKLEKSREIDAIKGGSSFGPHRSDLVFEFLPKNIPGFLCSTGEQKILVLGLVLASIKLLEIKSEGVPILLLDEVIAHLDEKYKKLLFKQIQSLNIQTWMTGVYREDFKELEDISIFFSPY